MATNKNRITFQCSDELKEALEACAQNSEQSVSAVIVGVLRNHLIKEGYINNSKKLTKVTSDRKT
jgi:uncharacterized CHY-type Zn-finger protein